MKNLSGYIYENKEDHQSSLGKKIFNIIGKDSSDIVAAIMKRIENWDNNKLDWSREPMFLIANSANKRSIESGEQVRRLTWVRKKFFKSALDFGDGIQGTLSDYNIENEIGEVPLAVLGIFFDRQFFPITSLDVYHSIKEIIEQNN